VTGTAGRLRRRAGTVVQAIPHRWAGLPTWVRRGLQACAACASLVAVLVALFVAQSFYYVYLDRSDLPDIEPFVRIDLPTIGRIYDVNGRPLIELAREYRQIVSYADIPPVVRDAILAAEDKRFFSHGGADYLILPRVIGKVRWGAWASWLVAGPGRDNAAGRAIFPQGGSTITQQLVRGVFLRGRTSQENSYELRNVTLLPRLLSTLVGARNVNMILRKREEVRLSVWLEHEMQERYGSKRRAKEEIFARYASFVYMGHGQFGFARAAEYYFDRDLKTFTAAHADMAAALAGIAKAPRDYAPSVGNTGPVLRRRNQILALMADAETLSIAQATEAAGRPLGAIARPVAPPFRSSAAVEHVLEELHATHPGLGGEDLLQGRVQVHSTIDARVQFIASAALEHGLERYEARHPRSLGLAQGAVVVLKNRDGAILAESGGRQVFGGRATSYSDFNRARESLRQPGSAMKPFVYLAAFRQGNFTLETLVPDDPIGVPDGGAGTWKWIANYDGLFKGLMPMREALAESRNAVAIWLAGQLGIDAVLQEARRLGIVTPLQPYAATALGASEVTLLELASAYRALASGIVTQPYVIVRAVWDVNGATDQDAHRASRVVIDDAALALVQEGLRGVVRLPIGTAHALDARRFGIPVMGKTGTTSDFRDALFVGSTYGPDGITVAVRVGFDDNRSLGRGETGGRVALPVFEEVMLAVYRDRLVGPIPSFPVAMERRITRYLQAPPDVALDVPSSETSQ
jgi:membrane peptidoglycan carboxypeptidase